MTVGVPAEGTAVERRVALVPASLGALSKAGIDVVVQRGAGAAAGFPDVADDRLLLSAKAGHDELKAELSRHTETSPKLTGGDIDARWQDAYAIGDETPGGDNPTPGQDRVDQIGRSLGVTYQDTQELKGGDEITDRDRHRWEYDPASSDDWPHDKKKKKSES